MTRYEKKLLVSVIAALVVCAVFIYASIHKKNHRPLFHNIYGRHEFAWTSHWSLCPPWADTAGNGCMVDEHLNIVLLLTGIASRSEGYVYDYFRPTESEVAIGFTTAEGVQNIVLSPRPDTVIFVMPSGEVLTGPLDVRAEQIVDIMFYSDSPVDNVVEELATSKQFEGKSIQRVARHVTSIIETENWSASVHHESKAIGHRTQDAEAERGR